MIPSRCLYLDHHATTPCDPQVVAAMLPYFTEQFGNAHSDDHVMGSAAEAAVETARGQVARLIGADPLEIVFTSGATESNNIAIKGALRHALHAGDPRRRVITLATEHKCVLDSVVEAAAEGFEPVVLPVNADGLLDLDRLRDALCVPTLLVSVMAANNEIGVLQDMAAISTLTADAGALLHCDAAQAVGKVPVDVVAMGADLLSVSAHKMYGPKGVGALRVRRRPRLRLAPLFSGGGQERGLRSGTLPVPLVVGFGEACRIAARQGVAEANRLAGLRDRLLDRLRSSIPGLRVNGSMTDRLPGNLNLLFPHAAAAAMIAACPDLCLSTGSACASGGLAPSYVLQAIGLSDRDARCSLRLGLGRFTSAADVDRAAARLGEAYAQVATARSPRSVEA